MEVWPDGLAILVGTRSGHLLRIDVRAATDRLRLQPVLLKKVNIQRGTYMHRCSFYDIDRFIISARICC
jgi:hypothetical protein